MATSCVSGGASISWGDRPVTGPMYCGNCARAAESGQDARGPETVSVRPFLDRDLVQPDGSLKCPRCGSTQFETKISTGRKLLSWRRRCPRIEGRDPTLCMRIELQASMTVHDPENCRLTAFGYFGAIIVASLAVLVTSACGGGARPSSDAFEESDLAAIVRGSGDASDGLNLVEDESGPQTLAQVAYELEISRSSLRKCGFVAASEAYFEGREALPRSAQAILFADPGGASCFLRLAGDVLDADEVADAQPIDASSLGAEAFGFSADLSFWEGSFYFWRIGNLVLGVFAQSEEARAFADQLDEQARAIG